MDQRNAETMHVPGPGSVLSGRYELGDELGHGGMGIVYAAVDLALGEPVAVKVLLPALSADEASCERLKEEARVAHRLSHPNIVQLRNFEEDGSAKFLVMELVEGVSLRDMLKQHGRLPLEKVLKLAEGMCAGLDYAHSRNVVHCDIKPENFLVGEDGVPKIADFGIARVTRGLQDMVQQKQIAGTPAFMSPEQFRGRPFDARTDIYGLGATIYEMLAGPAWPRGFMMPGAPMPPLDAVPDHVNMAVRMAMAPEPEQRWRTAADLLNALSSPAEAARLRRLPTRMTGFFGRTDELDRLSRLMTAADVRLITLTGPGGAGKTRLAVEVARRVAGAFDDSVWYVSLQDVADPGLIGDAVVLALGVTRRPGFSSLEQAGEFLSHSRCALVLDNFEQLVDGGAEVVRRLLDAAPTLTCLVTSRRLLALTGEREFLVRPLPVPSALDDPAELLKWPSVQLFLDRAQAARPDFRLTEENAAPVGELCCRLEGFPLALELAAARVRMVAPARILEQVDHRFDFLSSRKRDVEERHRSLRAAIDWSFLQLPSEQRLFFAGLSVFRGGWTADAARDVQRRPAALDDLEELRDCSLLTIDYAGPEPRFHMLETLRAYGAEHLPQEERDVLEVAHARYYLGLAVERTGGDEEEWLDAVEAEHQNMRQALESLLRRGDCDEDALRLAAALGRFWQARNYWDEGRHYLGEALSCDAAHMPTAVRASALSDAAGLASSQGDYTAARELFTQALGLQRDLGDKKAAAASLGYLGNALWRQGDYEGARALFEEALPLQEDLGEPAGVATALHNLGLVSAVSGDFATAEDLLSRSLAMRREVKDPWGIAESANDLGLIAKHYGNFEMAAGYLEEALAIRREMGRKDEIAISLNNLAALTVARGDMEAACRLYHDSLALSGELGHMSLVVESLGGIAEVCLSRDQAEDAARLYGAADAIREALNYRRTPEDEQDHTRRLNDLRRALGEDEYQAAWEGGRSMPAADAVAYALDLAPPQ
jgi:predicted ATPase